MSQKKNLGANLVYRTMGDLPVISLIKTEWDLATLYYANENDPQIELDIKHIIASYQKFAKKWRTAAFTTDPSILASALKDYEHLVADPRLSKPGRYFSLRAELDVTDSAADKALAIIQKRVRPAADGMLFFSLELGKISAVDQNKFLTTPELAPYRYFLAQLFKGAKHDLSEVEEKIISLKGQTAGLWQQMTEKQISSSTISWKGKNIPLPEAFETIETLTSADKPKLWKMIREKVDSFGIMAEHEFNAIITNVRNEDELRKYKKPYSATALSYQHDEKSIEALVEAVSTKGFALSKKFYALKAAYHGVEKIEYAQKYDTIGETLKVPFSQALEVCRDVFYQVNPLYGNQFDQMLTAGQLDVYPKKGKRGGAFMSDQTGHPIQVLLNQVDTMKSLETLAHEMGHAIHAGRSKTQSPLYDGHSIVTAETASTLFENLVFDAIYATADKDAKIILLHDKITGDIATMQRQIAFFNCELEIHNTIHAQGAMTHDELKQCMHRHLTSYLGSAVNVVPDDGASYVYIPHLRYGFYVYSYTFGNLMSTIMASKYQENNAYRAQIDTFLTAGQSDTVANIFKRININTTKPDTFTEALKAHEKNINDFKALIKKR